jgi:hypothetical protein
MGIFGLYENQTNKHERFSVTMISVHSVRSSTLLRNSALLALTLLLSFHAFASDSDLADKLKADYPLTKVGVSMMRFDYQRITAPGPVLTIRIPGIYADPAGTTQLIVNTNIVDGHASQQRGLLASMSNTSGSRTLNAGETVYVTKLDVKKDTVHLELLTEAVTTLGGGLGTRYRAEVVFHIPNLDTLTHEEVKKAIDAVIADPVSANAVQSKTVTIGMSPDNVKGALGNPAKIIDLGAKKVFVYPDMKIVFNDGKVSDVQ